TKVRQRLTWGWLVIHGAFPPGLAGTSYMWWMTTSAHRHAWPCRRHAFSRSKPDADMLRGLERLLKGHGFRPKVFQSAEAFFASVDDDDGALCLLLDVHLNGASWID